jgi:hypothetical protein
MRLAGHTVSKRKKIVTYKIPLIVRPVLTEAESVIKPIFFTHRLNT